MVAAQQFVRAITPVLNRLFLFGHQCHLELCDLNTVIRITQTLVVPIRDLFESHLTVVDLARSMTFFGQSLGLELADVFWDRRVAFYWIGGRGNSMLGLWEAGTS